MESVSAWTSKKMNGSLKLSPTNKNAPPLGSEWQRLAPLVMRIFACLVAVYIALWFVFKDSKSILGLPQPGEEFCEQSNSGVCSRSDLFAFQIASGLSFLVMGGFGFYYWHIRGIHLTSVPQTSAGRCFGYIPEAEFVAVVCFTFQLWDFLISLGIPEHRTPIMLVHHTLAAAVSLAGLHCQYMLWYSFYFFGLSELSSIFLVLLDTSKFFPPKEDSAFGAFVEGYCGPMFAFTFLFYRGIMWWRITYLQFSDSISIIRSGQATKLRPGKTWVLYVLMIFNLPMGMLQIYWSFLILEEVKKVFLDGVK